MVDVTPYNIDKSYLLHKLTGQAMCPDTNSMPPGSMLAMTDIQTITDWVCSGAKP